MEQKFLKIINEKVCLNDENLSLEAKGFYYSMLVNMYGGNNDIKDIIRNTNEDIEFVSKLIIELIKNGYLFIGINGGEQINSVFLWN